MNSWEGSELGVERGVGFPDELEGTLKFGFTAGVDGKLLEFFMFRERRRSAGDLTEEAELCVAFVADEAKNVEATSFVAEILSLATCVIGFDLTPRGQLPYHFVFVLEDD